MKTIAIFMKTLVNTLKAKFHIFTVLSFFTVVSQPLYASSSEGQLKNVKVLRFEQAISLAQKNDPWLLGNRHQQDAVESMSVAAGALPDPKVSIGIANLASDSFDFNQEPMTQFKVGVSQMFPRGDSLAIKNKQLKIQSQQFPYQRHDRQAKVAVTVGLLWLDAFSVQQSIKLIESNRSLFEQLGDVAQASYASAVGKTRQQDIVRAQLELTRLEDKLNQLHQQKNKQEGQLAQWLSTYLTGNDNASAYAMPLHNINFGNTIPNIDLLKPALINENHWQSPDKLAHYFSQHPAVLAIDKKILASKSSIALANQKYQPEWGVNASYAYRDDDPMGNDRSDFLSIGISFDVPLFTENKQDKEVKSAISQTEAIKTDKLLLLRKLIGNYQSAKGRLLQLNERKALYEKQLLPQIHDQAEASLTAYTNDDGDFSEVVRARIAVLNAEIDLLAINVEQQKIRLEVNYLFVRGEGVNSSVDFKSDQYQSATAEGEVK